MQYDTRVTAGQSSGEFVKLYSEGIRLPDYLLVWQVLHGFP